MSLLVYGGCFNPPHLGHRAAVEAAWAELRPERVLILPDREPPHKKPSPGEPPPEERLALCRLAFEGLPWAEVSDLSLRREGPSYMADTLDLLRQAFPGKEPVLLLGADMLPGIEHWYAHERLLRKLQLAVLCRDGGDEQSLRGIAHGLGLRYGTQVRFLHNALLSVSSTQLRQLLPLRQGETLLADRVYARIVQKRWYGTEVSLSWLRKQVYALLKPSRVPHVAGCEKAAAALARRWGENEALAAEAGILHDMTKRWSGEEQLRYCDENGILLDEVERRSPQLLHARTGAVEAKRLFGACDAVCEAIRWHTTGKPEMSLLEKILYLADVIEETRDYPGVEQLRALCFTDLDRAMAMAAESCLEHVREQGLEAHTDTVRAYRWYSRDGQDKEEFKC